MVNKNYRIRNKQFMNTKKVLIIRLGAIGDVVHTTETFRSIKRLYPEVKIHYLTSKVPSFLIENDPDLDKVIVIEKSNYKNIFKLAKELKSEKYDLIINLQPSLKLRLLNRLLFPKKVVNYKKTYKLHAVENFFDTAQKHFKTLQLNKKLKLYIPQETIKKISEKISTDSKLIAISTQAGPVRHGKKWNIDKFKELALKLAEKDNTKVLIVGSSEDREKVKDFENLHPNIIVYAGDFNILESAALLSLVDVFIASDTGPLHIASAVEKPICIGLYGAMAVPRTGIWGDKHFSIKSNLECVPCQQRYCKIKNGDYEPCMESISVSEILEVIEKQVQA